MPNRHIPSRVRTSMWRDIVFFCARTGGLQGGNQDEEFKGRPPSPCLPITTTRSGDHARPTLRQLGIAKVRVSGFSRILGGKNKPLTIACTHAFRDSLQRGIILQF